MMLSVQEQNYKGLELIHIFDIFHYLFWLMKHISEAGSASTIR